MRLKRIRKLPQQPTINVNLGLQLPLGIQPGAIPPQIQQAIQQILQQGGQTIRDQVIAEIARQSPVVGVQTRLLGAKWVKVV